MRWKSSTERFHKQRFRRSTTQAVQASAKLHPHLRLEHSHANLDSNPNPNTHPDTHYGNF